ncbi:hypothetical protein WJX72_000227 [[Myrmecia] bisecta]|uniref:Fungal lipase-type domain-containing protein n=1 Tax=[Myrmecia] bisecta TaxID=41462 RepID=A0AAW1PGT0_9CHLO
MGRLTGPLCSHHPPAFARQSPKATLSGSSAQPHRDAGTYHRPQPRSITSGQLTGLHLQRPWKAQRCHASSVSNDASAAAAAPGDDPRDIPAGSDPASLPQPGASDHTPAHREDHTSQHSANGHLPATAAAAAGGQPRSSTPPAGASRRANQAQARPRIPQERDYETRDAAYLMDPLRQVLTANWAQRVIGALRESSLLAYTTLIESILVTILDILQADRWLAWVTPKLEDAYATLTGRWYVLQSGERRAYSLVNNTAPNFDIPAAYNAAEFPQAGTGTDSRGYSASTAHLLSLAMKLVYEQEDVIKDIIERKWGLQYHSYLQTAAETTLDDNEQPGEHPEGKHREGSDPSKASPSGSRAAALAKSAPISITASSGNAASGRRMLGSSTTQRQEHEVQSDKEDMRDRKRVEKGRRSAPDFAPRTRACVFGTDKAVIVSFRGTEPTNLINLRSSGRISMSWREDMGRIHDGFYSSLFYESPDGGSLFNTLVDEMRRVSEGRQIFLTGHSLGGALANLFALGLQLRHPDLGERIGGIYSFGAPRMGDSAFADAYTNANPGKTFRMVYASDIIPKVPPRWLEYTHFGEERFLTTFGQLLDDPKQITKWRRREAWGFLPLGFYKIGHGVVGSDEHSLLRGLYRFMLLFVLPGLGDHWPSDYERMLRRQLQDRPAKEL